MHELSITQQILDIAVDKAREAQAQKVSRINLVVGEMSGVVDDCLQFYFDFMSKDTIAGEARLSFQRMPLKAKCRVCGNEFAPSHEPWTCPQCGKWDAEIISGNEFFVESIEVE